MAGGIRCGGTGDFDVGGSEYTRRVDLYILRGIGSFFWRFSTSELDAWSG